MVSTLLLHDLQWLTIVSPCFVFFFPSQGFFSLALPIWTVVFFQFDGSQRIEQGFSRYLLVGLFWEKERVLGFSFIGCREARG